MPCAPRAGRGGTVLAKNRLNNYVRNGKATIVRNRMNNLKAWPHLTVVALVFAALGVGAAALWTRHEPTAEALALPSAARVERGDGEVALSRGLSADRSDAGWFEVTP